MMHNFYQMDSQGSGMTGNTAAYPQTSTALSPRLANFQLSQPMSGDINALDSRNNFINQSQSEAMGTPIHPHNASSIGQGHGSDLSPSSPYRIMTSGTPGAGKSSPLQASSSILPPASTTMPTNLSRIPSLQNNPTIIRTEGNVIYSTQPLTAADFGAMMGGSNVTGMLPPPPMPSMMPQSQTTFSQFAQVNMSSSPLNSFTPMPAMPFPQATTGLFSGAPMTPRLLGPMQPLTPRGFTQMPFQTGQVGMTPRSYMTEQVMSSSIIPAPQPMDPAMMMFAESFKNQCIALQQYYSSHPDEMPESPKSEGMHHQPLFKRARMQQSLLRSIPDQENMEANNRTPSPTSVDIKKRDEDDVMDILNRLVGEDQPKMEVEEKRTESPLVNVPVGIPMSPVVSRRPQSGFEAFLQRFGCGSQRS